MFLVTYASCSALTRSLNAARGAVSLDSVRGRRCPIRQAQRLQYPSGRLLGVPGRLKDTLCQLRDGLPHYCTRGSGALTYKRRISQI